MRSTAFVTCLTRRQFDFLIFYGCFDFLGVVYSVKSNYLFLRFGLFFMDCHITAYVFPLRVRWSFDVPRYYQHIILDVTFLNMFIYPFNRKIIALICLLFTIALVVFAIMGNSFSVSYSPVDSSARYSSMLKDRYSLYCALLSPLLQVSFLSLKVYHFLARPFRARTAPTNWNVVPWSSISCWCWILLAGIWPVLFPVFDLSSNFSPLSFSFVKGLENVGDENVVVQPVLFVILIFSCPYWLTESIMFRWWWEGGRVLFIFVLARLAHRDV